MSDEEITVNWYCATFVGPAKWKFSGDWILEPDECCTEFTTEDIRENWDENCCVATCPSCGAELTQEYDCPEIAGARDLPRSYE